MNKIEKEQDDPHAHLCYLIRCLKNGQEIGTTTFDGQLYMGVTIRGDRIFATGHNRNEGITAHMSLLNLICYSERWSTLHDLQTRGVKV